MVWKTRISIHPSCQEILLKGIRRETSIICIKNLLHISCNRKDLWFSWIYYWAACAPSHKMGVRASGSKSGLPGEGRHEGLGPRNDVLTNGFIWVSLARTLHGYFLYLVCAPPEKPTKRCEPEEGYLRCSKLFDHGSNSIIFLLFEFKSVRWCWRWETQRNARVAFKPTRRSR